MTDAEMFKAFAEIRQDYERLVREAGQAEQRVPGGTLAVSCDTGTKCYVGTPSVMKAKPDGPTRDRTSGVS